MKHFWRLCLLLTVGLIAGPLYGNARVPGSSLGDRHYQANDMLQKLQEALAMVSRRRVCDVKECECGEDKFQGLLARIPQFNDG